MAKEQVLAVALGQGREVGRDREGTGRDYKGDPGKFRGDARVHRLHQGDGFMGKCIGHFTHVQLFFLPVTPQ